MKHLCTLLLLLVLITGLTACNINRTLNNTNQDTKTTDTLSKKESSSNSKANLTGDSTINRDNENLSELEEEGLEVLEDQSFWVELENWGKVRFISSEFPYGGTYKLKFYLVNAAGEVLYKFPEFYGNQWSTVFEFKAVSFKDVNNDGLKDIIIIADYLTGVGQNGATPFHVGSVYFQKDKGFINLPDLDQQINDLEKNETVDIVVKFVESKNIKLNK